MYRPPPRWAELFLAWALGPGDDARSILGDVNEDFATELELRGRLRAHVWYWIEALALGASALWGRALGKPIARTTMGGETVMDVLSSNGFVQDARYALRAIRKDTGFAAFATAIIGLGVGACTAVFSVMSPLLIQPLPFEAPERLTVVALSDAEGEGLSAVTSRTSNVRDFRAMARSFEAIGGFNAFFEQMSYNLVSADGSERLVAVDVTQNFLDVLGVSPEVGRNFVSDEGVFGGRPAIILSHGFWQRRFAGDRGVVGTSVNIDDTPTEVVGVLPESFDFSATFAPTTDVDFLRPWPISDETDRWGNTTTMVARLSPGATIPQAQAELESIITGLEEADPERWGLGAAVSGLQEKIARPYRSAMMLLAAAAAMVMAIVCVNLSNMLLARGPRRRREMAVRMTMGAPRGRLVRQLLLESVTISMAGAVVGAVVAYGATRFVTRTAGLEIPLLSTVSIDGLALAFAAGVAMLAGLAVGIIPALQVAEGREAEALRSSSRGSTGGLRGRRTRELLVVAEMAVACVLLVVGGLVLKSFQQVMQVDIGFEAENSVAWRISTTREFESLNEAVAFYDELTASVSSVPGVESVGLVDALPLGRQRTWGTRVVGVEYREDTELETTFFPHIVDTGYLESMGIPLLEGRGLTVDDNQESARVALVNETAARQMFPGGNAVGQFLTMGGEDGTQVVGVVGDVAHVALDAGYGNEVYVPMRQVWDFNTPDLVVRSRLSAEEITAPVRAALLSVDPQMPTEDFRTLESIVDVSVSPRRFTLRLLAAFALSALLLAGIGMYGVLSYTVTERIPEIGIRMALGESAAEVRRSIVAKTLGLAGVGVFVGLIGSLAGTRLLGSLLFGVEPTDPVTFALMVLLLLAVAFVSGLIPAVRASRTDSATALRSVS